MGSLRLKGVVFSGEGEGGKFVNLRWARKQIREQLGFSPYSGTLNIRLTEESIRARRSLTRAEGLRISSPQGFFPGKLFRASLMSLKCAVIIPQVPRYPRDVVELVSSTNLRSTLHLVDGSTCDVEVTL